MEVNLEARPSYAMAVVKLNKGEKFVSEAGAMVAHTPGLDISTGFQGTGGGFLNMVTAILAGIARKFLAGESMFVNNFTAKQDGAEVMLAPAMSGDIVEIDLDGSSPVIVQAESFLASEPGVNVGLIFGGIGMLMSGEGAFFLKCTGKGKLLINSYGAIEEVQLGEDGYVADNGHIVGWQGKVTYKMRGAGGLMASMTSGEGMVVEFKGDGKVWLQTRNVPSMVDWISPFLPG